MMLGEKISLPPDSTLNFCLWNSVMPLMLPGNRIVILRSIHLSLCQGPISYFVSFPPHPHSQQSEEDFHRLLLTSNSGCNPYSALPFAFRDESPILLSGSNYSIQTIIAPFSLLKLSAEFFSSLSFCSPLVHSYPFTNMPLFLPS